MLAALITLVFIAAIAYELFLAPVPDEETLKEEGIDEEEYARTTVYNLAACVIGIILTNIIAVINYLVA